MGSSEGWHCVTGMGVPEEKAGEATGKDSSSVAVETPNFLRYQYYGIITKDNSNSGVELAQGYLSDKLIMLQKADMDKWNCTGFEIQKIVILSQTSSTELFTVLYFGLVLVLL